LPKADHPVDGRAAHPAEIRSHLPALRQERPPGMGASQTGYSDFRVDPPAFQRIDQRTLMLPSSELACFLRARSTL
jgi:hypothetical protein